MSHSLVCVGSNKERRVDANIIYRNLNLYRLEHSMYMHKAWLFKGWDSGIQLIKSCPVDKSDYQEKLLYPLDSDLSSV